MKFDERKILVEKEQPSFGIYLLKKEFRYRATYSDGRYTYGSFGKTKAEALKKLKTALNDPEYDWKKSTVHWKTGDDEE